MSEQKAKPSKRHTKNKNHQNHRKNYGGKHFASTGQGFVPSRGAFTRRPGTFTTRTDEVEDHRDYGRREIESNAYRFEEGYSDEESDEEDTASSMQKQREQQMQTISTLLSDAGSGAAYAKKPWEREWDVVDQEPVDSVLSIDAFQLYDDISHLSVEHRLHLEQHSDKLDPVLQISTAPASQVAVESSIPSTEVFEPLTMYKDGRKEIVTEKVQEYVSDSDEEETTTPVQIQKPKQVEEKVQKPATKPIKFTPQMAEKKPTIHKSTIKETKEEEDMEFLAELEKVSINPRVEETSAPVAPYVAPAVLHFEKEKPQAKPVVAKEENFDDWLDELVK